MLSPTGPTPGGKVCDCAVIYNAPLITIKESALRRQRGTNRHERKVEERSIFIKLFVGIWCLINGYRGYTPDISGAQADSREEGCLVLIPEAIGA
jgi:hypothetical protein